MLEAIEPALHLHELTFSVSTDELTVPTMAFRSLAYIDKVNVALADALTMASESSKPNALCYRWAYEAKEVAILLRNALLNLLKLKHYHKDGLRTDYDVLTYKKQLQDTIHSATYHLMHSHDVMADDSSYPDEWSQQVNPVPTITEQLHTVADQIKKIRRASHKLDLLHTKFADYRESYAEHMRQRAVRVVGIHQSLEDLRGNLPDEEELEADQLAHLVKQIQTKITTLDNLPMLPAYEYIVLEDTDKLRLAVASDQGRLRYKSVEILSEVSGWASFHLTTPLKSVDAKLHTFTEQTKASLYQIMNRLKARLDSGKDSPTIPRAEVLSLLTKIIDDCTTDVVPATVGKVEEISAELSKQINCSQLFSEKYNFLPNTALGPVPGLTDRSVLEKRYRWANIKSKADKVSSQFFSKYTEEEQLTAAGYISKILSFNPESDVNALFLRKGFLGSSFTVARPQIFGAIQQHFELWQQGYGGSLLINGGHGTGRSTVLEMIPNMYPEVDSHHIVQGQKIDVYGHKHLVTHDLITAVKFVVRHATNKSCIVSIDDLEYYSNTPEMTYDIFSELLQIVRRHNKKIYFAVTLHKYLLQKLEHYFDIENPFTAVVSTDHMPVDKIEAAVLTRAHAVANHEELAKQSEEISAIARKVARRARHNVGRAMQLWCMLHGQYENDNGDIKFKQLVLQHEELLKTLFRHGPVYEPYLRSMLNDIDAADLKAEIEGLTRIKLLVRPEDGYIKVNPYLQSTIEATLN